MLTDAIASGWVPVARETFECNLVPRFGRRHAPWLRLVAREHPADSTGLVLVEETNDDVLVRAELHGLGAQDFTVEATSEHLIIRAEGCAALRN